MDTKRRAVALTVAVLLAAPLGVSRAAFAAGEEASATPLPRLEPAHGADDSDDDSGRSTDPERSDGSNPADTGDPGDTDPGEIREPGRDTEDSDQNGRCTSVNSGAPSFGPTTVCTGEHRTT